MLYKARFFEHFFQRSHLLAGLDESCDRIADISPGLLEISSARRYVKGYTMGDYDRTLFKVDDRNRLELDTHLIASYSLQFSTDAFGYTTSDAPLSTTMEPQPAEWSTHLLASTSSNAISLVKQFDKPGLRG